MKIVDRVDIALNKIASMDDGNSFPETSRGESSTQKSTIVEAPNLERSYVQGFIHGSAWKDVTISSMQRSYSFRISPLTNPLQLPINLQSIDAQRTDFLEKAINWLALHMMSEQTHPALLFSNWDGLGYYTKNYIIDSARRKCQMLKAYNGVCVSHSFFCFLESFSVFDIYSYRYDSTGC
uniref:Disease resistance protein RPS4 n=1 Tax=Noccaea caerulescens TaxID=107243 RepID=A0A1J3JT28_NOCCA